MRKMVETKHIFGAGAISLDIKLGRRQPRLARKRENRTKFEICGFKRHPGGPVYSSHPTFHPTNPLTVVTTGLFPPLIKTERKLIQSSGSYSLRGPFTRISLALIFNRGSGIYNSDLTERNKGLNWWFSGRRQVHVQRL